MTWMRPVYILFSVVANRHRADGNVQANEIFRLCGGGEAFAQEGEGGAEEDTADDEEG